MGLAFVHAVGLADTALSALSKSLNSDSAKQFSQTLPQSAGDLLDIHQRHISDPALYAAVVRPMQPASFRSLFLIDLLLLAHATDRAAKPDADVDGHRVGYWPGAADA